MTDAAVAVAGAWTTDPSLLPAELHGTFRAVMGWGGMAVWDESVDIVDLTREYARQTVQECCGQCFPCRIGMHEVGDILEEICEGRGTRGAPAARLRARAARRRGLALRPRPLRRLRGARVARAEPRGLRGRRRRREGHPPRHLRPRRRRAVHGRLPGRRGHPGLRGAAAHRRGRALVRGRAQALPHAGHHRPRLRASLRGRLPPRLGGRAGRHPHAQALRGRQRGRDHAARAARQAPGRHHRRRAGRPGLRLLPRPRGRQEHHPRGAARGRRHGRRRHPRLPPAAPGAARRDRPRARPSAPRSGTTPASAST